MAAANRVGKRRLNSGNIHPNYLGECLSFYNCGHTEVCRILQHKSMASIACCPVQWAGGS